MLHERRDGSTYNSLDLLEPYEETYDQVVQRAKETIRYVKGLPHKSVCIISHGTFIECFLQAMGIDIKEEEIPNCYQTTVFL